MAGGNGQELKGVIPAIITPMKEEGEIDFTLLEKQAGYLSEAGVNGFFIGGTTGEGAYLSTTEKGEAFRVVRGVIKKEQFLCAAYIQPSTSMVLEEMKALAATEPDYVVAVTPYYLTMRQYDIIEHYRAIARRAPAPVILYNIPSNTHNPIELETVLALSSEPNIIGIKDSTGNLIPFSRGMLENSPDGFAWIQGEDYLDAPALLLGADGVVTGLGNARIEPYIQMREAIQAGELGKVCECQARIDTVYEVIRLCGTPITGIKAATELSGRGSRWMRQKSLSATDEQIEKIRKVLDAFDSR